IDLLRWLVDKLQAKAAFRQDLPRFSSAEAKQAQMEKLRSELLTQWNESLLDSYFDDYDAMAEPRPVINLPLSVTAEAFIPPDDALIKLTALRPLRLIVNDGILELKFNKKLWRFAGDSILIFRKLENGNICSV